MKKTMTLLAAAAVALFASTVWGDEVKIGDQTWQYTTHGSKATITGVSPASGTIEVPDSIETEDNVYLVTGIGWNAFAGSTSLTSVTIPDGVTVIGAYAFSACSSVTNVTIPNSVTKIAWSTFSGCTALKGVTLPGGLTDIGAYAFQNCASLTNMVMPDSVTRIGEYAFSGCIGLARATIGKGVTQIEPHAFEGCISLTGVSLPDGVADIGFSAFRGCTSLASVAIPNSVESIGRAAFASCSSLESVTIPQGVKHVGAFAFGWCGGLSSVTILSNDVGLEDYAFGSCPALSNVSAPAELKGRIDESLVFGADVKVSYGVLVQTVVAKGQEAMGSVSGDGVYQTGKKALLKATPNTGYAFEGWYLDGAFLSQSPSYSYLVGGTNVVIEARFVSTGDDAESLTVDVPDATTEKDGSFSLDLGACVTSLSLPKISVSGLPAGLKFAANTGFITGKATKPGVYAVKVSVTNASVKKAVVKEFLLTVPNFAWDSAAVGVELEDRYLLRAGVAPDMSAVLSAVAANGWTLAVSGLPSGVKFDAKTGAISGVATKEGYSTVYFTAKKGKEKQVATTTFEVVFAELSMTTAAHGDASAAGTVKGAGRYPFGKKVTVTATAAKGSAFAGWDGADELLNGQDARAASLSFIMPSNDVSLAAVFATAAEDKNSIAMAVDGEGMDAGNAASWTNFCGVAVALPVVADALSQTTVKAAGLPAGVKLVQDKVTKAYSLAGAPTAASKADKNTGVLSPAKVKLTVTTAGKSSQTFAIDWVILPLPAWAQGTFDGMALTGPTNDPSVGESPCGLVSFTVSAAGKISGKLVNDDGTWTLSAASYDRMESPEALESPDRQTAFVATVIGKNGKRVFTNEMTVVEETLQRVGDEKLYSRGVVSGGPQSSAAEWTAWQNLWKTEPWKTDAKPFAKAPVLTLGTLTLKFDASGVVKTSAKFVTGQDAKGKDVTYSATCSSALIPKTDGTELSVTLYFPPKTGKFEGYAAEIPLVWDGSKFGYNGD